MKFLVQVSKFCSLCCSVFLIIRKIWKRRLFSCRKSKVILLWSVNFQGFLFFVPLRFCKRIKASFFLYRRYYYIRKFLFVKFLETFFLDFYFLLFILNLQLGGRLAKNKIWTHGFDCATYIQKAHNQSTLIVCFLLFTKSKWKKRLFFIRIGLITRKKWRTRKNDNFWIWFWIIKIEFPSIHNDEWNSFDQGSKNNWTKTIKNEMK